MTKKIFTKLKAIFNMLVHPFYIFKHFRLYILVGIDFAFMLLVLGLGLLLSKYKPSPYTSLLISVFISFIMLLCIFLAYATSKYIFYYFAGQPERFSSILLTHLPGLVLLILMNYLIFMPFYILADFLVIDEKVSSIKFVIRLILYFLVYIMFLSFHKYSSLPFFKRVWKSFTSAFRIKSYSMIYLDAVLLLLAYLLFNISAILFRLAFLYISQNPSLLDFLFRLSSSVIVLLFIAFTIAVNKIITYDPKL
jgi:hypothetical protein